MYPSGSSVNSQQNAGKQMLQYVNMTLLAATPEPLPGEKKLRRPKGACAESGAPAAVRVW
jgi:hypothetical protein